MKSPKVASSWRAQPSRTMEDYLENAIRKLYPYVNATRNPMRFRVGGRRVAISHDGSKGQYFGIYQCFYKHQYEVPKPQFTPPHHADALQARYDALVARGVQPLIVDCGANIGAASLWFHARYPAARIIAVEPAPENLDLLRRNAQSSGISVVAAAIGDHDGKAFLESDDSDSLSHRVVPNGRGASVALISLRSLLNEASDAEPFILKVDIEGAEKSLFAGNATDLARFPLIVVEPHDFCMPGDDVSGPLFAFHAREGRDFLFGSENVFSVDFKNLRQDLERASSKDN